MGAVVVLQRHPERNVGGGVVDAALLHLTDRGECLGCKTNQGRGVKSIESINNVGKTKVMPKHIKTQFVNNSQIHVKKKNHVKNQFVVMNQIVVNLTGGGFAKRGVVIQCPAAFDVVQG